MSRRSRDVEDCVAMKCVFSVTHAVVSAGFRLDTALLSVTEAVEESLPPLSEDDMQY